MKVCSICQRCYPDAADVCRQDGSDEFAKVGNCDPEMVPGYILTRRVDISRGVDTYEANETESGSPCVIKIFSSATADTILTEANAVKALFYPGVISVYDVDRIDDGRVFVVSEAAKGQTLRALLTSVGPPDLLASIEIIRQTAEALQALHDKGVTHGAINPENISLTSGKDGHAVVRVGNVDFGRAVEKAITSNKFEIDSHVDALRYFSPELCTGEERTPRSDVYSLGIVFYELLSGAPPFDSTNAAGLIEKHRHERPPELRINNFELRMLITHALSESLQKQPAFRQASANAFARQLRHIEQLATHSSTPPPAVKAATRVVPTSTPRIEIYQPVPAAKIADPDITHVAPRARIEAKPKSVEPSDVPSVEVIAISDPPPEITVKTPALPIAVEAQPTLPKRSRLRSLKRKLHALSTAVASTIERGTLASIAGELASLATKDDTPSKNAPRKIEWIQPEDDIPTVEEVVKALAVEGKTGADIGLATPQEQPRATGQLITLDLSSVTAVDPPRAVVAKPAEPTKVEPVIAKPVETPKIEIPKAVVVAPVESPKPVATDPKKPVVPVEKVPAIPAVVAAPPSKAIKPKPRIETQPQVARPTMGVVIKPQAQAVVVTTPVYADDEEITLVRAPKQKLRIDLAKPKTIYRTQTAYARSAADISFQPTMIGERKEKRTRPAAAPELQEGMFSAHFGSSLVLADVKYRSMAIGVGCIVLATLFLFASDAVSRFFSSGDSATAQATVSDTVTATAPSVDPVFTPTRASLRNSSETPATETKPAKIVDDSKPASKAASEKEKPKETPKAASKSTQEKPVQKRAEPEPPKKQPVTRPAFPDLGRPSGATRPRIVKDPRP